MEPTIPQLTFLKKDSVITLSIGTRLIESLLVCQQYLLEGRSKEEIEGIKTHIAGGQELSSWETSLVAIGTLIKNVYDTAESTGCIEHRGLDTVMREG